LISWSLCEYWQIRFRSAERGRLRTGVENNNNALMTSGAGIVLFRVPVGYSISTSVDINVIDINNIEKYVFDWVLACYCTALISGYQGLSGRVSASGRVRSDTVCGGNATGENRAQQDTIMTVYALRRSVTGRRTRLLDCSCCITAFFFVSRVLLLRLSVSVLLVFSLSLSDSRAT